MKTIWYLAEMAGQIGYSLNEVAEWNIHKLASRKEAGTIRGEGDQR